MPTRHEQIKTLLNEEKTQEALALFAETASPESELLQGRYDRLLEAKAFGKGSAEQWQIDLNRIRFALLEFTKPETSAPEPSTDPQEQTRQLIAKGETEAALQLLLSLGNAEAEALFARWKAAQKQYASKEIDFGRLSGIQAEIAHETLLLSQGKTLSESPPAKPAIAKPYPVPLIEASQKLTPKEAAPLIRNALRNGNLEEAIHLLFRADMAIANALHARFSESERQNVLGLLDFGERSRVQTQICSAILQCSEMLLTEPSRAPNATEKVEILQLLHEQKTEKALQRCQVFGDEYLLLQAQFSIAQKDWRKNLIESEYFEAIKSKVNYSLQELMGQITEPSPAVPAEGLLGKIFGLFK